MTFAAFLLLAQAAPAGEAVTPAGGLGSMLVPMVLMIVVFYFLLIRPQQKQRKAHEQLVSSVKTGDQVVTSSGIHGIIANVKERTVIIKIADNVKVEFDRAAISAVEKSSESAEPAKS